jgi:tetratricopeptide (TPR) repeat protein
VPDTNKVALIIGIDVYYHEGLDRKPSLSQLPSCRKDAMDMHDLLSQLNYTIFGDVPLIGSNLDKESGFLRVHRAIRDFFDNGEAGQTLLLYYSGHGLPRREEVYLSTPQVNPKQPMIEGFSLSNLTDLMDSCRSTRIVCVIDACFSGAAKLPTPGVNDKNAAEADANVALANFDRIVNIPKAEGRCLLLSSQAYERSRAIENNNSIYTKYLLEGLRGTKSSTDGKGIEIPASFDDNGNVTPETLHEYVYYKVANEANQVPKIKSDKSSKIILATYPKLARDVDQSPPVKSNIGELMNEGRDFIDYGNYEEAMQCYDKVIALNAKHPGAWHQKGRVFYLSGRYDEATECYDRAIALQPKYFSVLRDKGIVLYKIRKYVEAIRWYDKALEIDPDDDSTLHYKTLAANELNKVEISKYSIEQQITKPSEAKPGKINDSATTLHGDIEKNETDSDVWYEKAYGLSNLGKNEEAIKYLDKALEIDPNNANALTSKGLALYNLGNYQEAVKYHDKALEINPNGGPALNNKGLALYGLGKYDEALEYYDRALEIDPNGGPAALLLSNKGLAFEKLGKHQEAIKWCDKALEINPNNGEALSTKGSAFYNLGKFEEALEYCDKALEINAKYVDVLNTKGSALYMLGKYEEALEYYDKALEIDPNNADILSNKGFAVDELGKRVKWYTSDGKPGKRVKWYTSDGKPVYE